MTIYSVNTAIATANDQNSLGDEYGIVILSTVRSRPREEIKNSQLVLADKEWLSEHLGFITDKHKINVGITRSKYGLVIIGEHTICFMIPIHACMCT